MHDYCNMFLPHLEHPKLATEEKSTLGILICLLNMRTVEPHL